MRSITLGDSLPGTVPVEFACLNMLQFGSLWHRIEKCSALVDCHVVRAVLRFHVDSTTGNSRNLASIPWQREKEPKKRYTFVISSVAHRSVTYWTKALAWIYNWSFLGLFISLGLILFQSKMFDLMHLGYLDKNMAVFWPCGHSKTMATSHKLAFFPLDSHERRPLYHLHIWFVVKRNQ